MLNAILLLCRGVLEHLAGNLVGSRFQEWKFMPGISDYGKPVIHWVARVQIPPSAPRLQIYFGLCGGLIRLFDVKNVT